jgi:TatD DNase family protein
MIDCHAHLAGEDFDADRDAVRERAEVAGVHAVLVVGEDPDDNARVLRVIAQGDESGCEVMTRLLPCPGFQPDRFADDRPMPTREDMDTAIAQIRKHRNDIAAIGEVGLDSWWVKDPERRRIQRSLLEEIAALSIELALPLNVHSRYAGHHTVDLLLAAGARCVLMHAFDGRASQAVRAAGAGYLFFVPPSVVRSEQKQNREIRPHGALRRARQGAVSTLGHVNNHVSPIKASR